MQLFVSDDEFKRLETRLTQQVNLTNLVELAWHCRQRDTRRALQLLQHAKKLVRHAGLNAHQSTRMMARMRLIKAEANWLFTHLEQAKTTARRALQGFVRIDDVCGQADAHWIIGRILFEQGFATELENALQQAKRLSHQANDAARASFFEADCASFTAFRDYSAAKAQWYQPLQDALDHAPDISRGAIHFFLGVIAILATELDQSLPGFMQAYENALKFGQIRLAIISASNVGNALCELNDYQSALDWGQRALDLAQSAGWPSSIATCMRQSAQPMRQLKQFDAARQMLEQALLTLQSLPPFRNLAVTLLYLGELTYDQQDYAQAQSYFEQTWALSEQLKQTDLMLFAQRNLARTLSQRNQGYAALAIAREALANARSHQIVLEQIKLYQVLSEIYGRHKMPCDISNPRLYYLQQSYQLVGQVQGLQPSVELLEALAQAQAAAGQFEAAFHTSQQAITAREKSHNQEATNRAVAMQVRMQTERTLAEGEHHRQLAASEAQRAELLQQTSATLLHLSAIGQELTTQLQQDAVLEIINRHVHHLLDATSFEVYLLSEDQHALQAVFAIEAGRHLPLISLSLDDPHSNNVRALTRRCEILLDIDPNHLPESQIPGTLQPASALFAPLMIGERGMGVMTVQTLRRHAYAERERLIFRTLCAYGAIALANAQANLRLQENALQLEQARARAEQATRLKSAFLANMSHEIRTPMNAVIGLAHLALQSGLNPRQYDYVHKIHSSGLSLLGILNDILDLSKIEAGRLDIEHIAFDLNEVLQHVADVCAQKAQDKQLALRFQVPAGLPRIRAGDPLRLGQVLINLVNNAIKFCPAGEVVVHICTDSSAAQLFFEVRDTGIGMSPEQCQRLFHAFNQADSSTSHKYGGTGLGLSISQHLVQLMGGQIQVESKLGQGSRFYFSLPLAEAIMPGGPITGHSSNVNPPENQPPPLPPGQYRVLLAEDNDINQEIAIELLAQCGVQADVALNGREVLHLLNQAGPHCYSLILMDLEMPEMDGHEAAQLIRQQACYAHIPIIAMSAHALLETREQCRADGMQDYIAKPIHPQLIHTILSRWLLAGSNSQALTAGQASAG
ncbi:MAG: hypothetical protein RL748_717 [Pseudomonadota bacterium]|jgi:signal transduction histidine kinase